MFNLGNNPLTISGVLKSSWHLYKSSIVYVILWSFIISLVHVTPYVFGFMGYYQNVNGHWVFSWWGALIYLILLAPEAFFVALLFYNMYSIATKHKVDHPEAIKVAISQYVPLYAGMILYYLFVALGMFLFILPAVYVGTLFALFLPALLIDKQQTYQAFETSVRLVWRHWWQTFIVLAIPYLLSYLARNIGKLFPWGEYDLLIDLVVFSIIMPYFYCVVFIQYNNLRIIKSLPSPISDVSRTQPLP